ncbi:hypothetical protein E2P81_ATG00098 [Venturia nashicola]|nr:hypothetical protein E2P81_ATG00098 [Venturia nashicola]
MNERAVAVARDDDKAGKAIKRSKAAWKATIESEKPWAYEKLVRAWVVSYGRIDPPEWQIPTTATKAPPKTPVKRRKYIIDEASPPDDSGPSSKKHKNDVVVKTEALEPAFDEVYEQDFGHEVWKATNMSLGIDPAQQLLNAIQYNLA